MTSFLSSRSRRTTSETLKTSKFNPLFPVVLLLASMKTIAFNGSATTISIAKNPSYLFIDDSTTSL